MKNDPKKRRNKNIFAHAKKTLQNLLPIFHMLDFAFSATHICVCLNMSRRKSGGFLLSAHQYTSCTYVFLRPRAIGLSRHVNIRARKHVVCQVFFSPGRPEKTHFGGAALGSTFLRNQMMIVAAWHRLPPERQGRHPMGGTPGAPVGAATP